MPKALYVWKGKYPWDVRAEKICKALIKAGFEVYLLARWINGQSEREVLDGINIIRVGYKKNSILTQPISINPIWQKGIKQIVEEINPDIIIPRDIMLAETCGKIGNKNNIPVVMDMAEHYPAAMKDWKKYKKSFLSRLLVHQLDIPELVEKRSVRLMEGVITVCQEQSQRLNSEYDFDLNNIQVVHNTPEISTFETIKHKTYSSTINFGHHGYITAEKSIEKFLIGFILAAEVDDTIQFTIAGEGESIDDLKEIANKSKVSDRIHFLGNYKFNELESIISKIDIGVIPYQISDFNNYTIHNKLFDFFAAGKSVLVSETKPFVRVIKETNAGIIVNCKDIEEIKNNILNIRNHNLKQMSINAKKAFHEKYNWEIDSKALLNFIHKIL